MNIIKKLIPCLICFYSWNGFASHIQGGTLYWECTPTGKFIFYGDFYRVCLGVGQNYTETEVLINGNPLPTNSINIPINKFNFYPDSARWQNNNFGYTDTICKTNTGNPCSSNMIFQHFYYKSDTLELNGLPPANGWQFSWYIVGSRGGLQNISSSDVVFQAIMYANPANGSTNKCFDYPPQFIDKELPKFCVNNFFQFSNTAIDRELDSISYAWDVISLNSRNQLFPANYVNNFTFQNPTPDTRFHPSNIAAQLNARNGSISLAVYSDTIVGLFGTVIRADSWKNGIKVASIFNDRAIYIENCNSSSSVYVNSKPFLLNNGDTLRRDTIKVVAGNELNYTILAKDLDTSQRIRSVITSTIMSTSLLDTADCKFPPCATFDPIDPHIHFIPTPYNTYLYSNDSILGTIKWKTNSSHLQNDSCTLYDIDFYLIDSYCPIPLSFNERLTVIVAIDSNNCKPVSVKENYFHSLNYKLFPNPSEGTFKLNFSEIQSQLNIRVRDKQGKIIATHTLKNIINSEFEINGNKGIYFLDLYNEKGERAFGKAIKF